jgi:hypothetical protein
LGPVFGRSQTRGRNLKTGIDLHAREADSNSYPCQLRTGDAFVLDSGEDFIGNKLLLLPSMEEDKGELGCDDGLWSWPGGLHVQGKQVRESRPRGKRKR